MSSVKNIYTVGTNLVRNISTARTGSVPSPVSPWRAGKDRRKSDAAVVCPFARARARAASAAVGAEKEKSYSEVGDVVVGKDRKKSEAAVVCPLASARAFEFKNLGIKDGNLGN
jgi:hypothetical protein